MTQSVTSSRKLLGRIASAVAYFLGLRLNLYALHDTARVKNTRKSRLPNLGWITVPALARKICVIAPDGRSGLLHAGVLERRQ